MPSYFSLFRLIPFSLSFLFSTHDRHTAPRIKSPAEELSDINQKIIAVRKKRSDLGEVKNLKSKEHSSPLDQEGSCTFGKVYSSTFTGKEGSSVFKEPSSPFRVTGSRDRGGGVGDKVGGGRAEFYHPSLEFAVEKLLHSPYLVSPDRHYPGECRL